MLIILCIVIIQKSRVINITVIVRERFVKANNKYKLVSFLSHFFLLIRIYINPIRGRIKQRKKINLSLKLQDVKILSFI